ncbi:alpha/beta hydrolase [Isoptericola cucumis]|uniref:Lysophospholipase n=1 Tax=Isoptericola cucumis TaxID=1776856 RepID=A0ABQ2BBW8_9MICO|nr:alpha/beta hydrolase [Isoptericola cucumis]GGI10481.1 lysophospholipase [Isoptericola cucumis]
MSQPRTGTTPDDRPAAGRVWRPDVLPGFEQRTLELEPDFEGECVATLVRRAPTALADAAVPDAGVDVLYVHGWNDYYFQPHLAAFWEARGARFYALDLRKYGRSLRSWQTPGFITRLRTYDEEIEAALAVVGHGPDRAPEQEHGPHAGERRRLVLMGHSTGGLVLSLWLAHHPGRAEALVLNSPWLEFQTRHLGRRMLEPGVRVQAALAPLSHMINLDQGFYARSISTRFDGEWDYEPEWRSDTGWRPTPAWLSAVFRGHDRVARGLGLEVPVLVLLSARSTPPVRWSEDMMRTDTVLDVVGVARRAADLGSRVTIVRLEGALHDVTLSAAPVRDAVWAETSRWLRAYLPTGRDAEPAQQPWWRRLFGRRGPAAPTRALTAAAPSRSPRPPSG